MKLIINNIIMSLDDDAESLRIAASRKSGINPGEMLSLRIVKESVDARRKPDIKLVYSIMVETDVKTGIRSDRDIRPVDDTAVEIPVPGTKKMHNRPIIIGSGPAGLFAGLVMAQNGYRPLIVERGEQVEKRTATVERYWKGGALNPETNVQFGEGGAGTFSDGKLTTRINDPRSGRILEELRICGAPEEILYRAKPHVGTDILKKVVVSMRNRIIGYGGEIRFNTKLTSIEIKDNGITAVVLNGNERIDADVVVLAIGHSARDTFEMLFSKGVAFERKPFSMGVRIEHPQELIDRAQYGSAAGHPALGAAEYQLFYKTQRRAVYTFCMCPGGVVAASASEPDMIVTNGMSEYARNGENANSALVVSVTPEDFEGIHPLAGIEFQRRWEKLAYNIGGNGCAPVQRLADFLNGVDTGKLGTVRPTYTGKTEICDLNLCLPVYAAELIRESIGFFDTRLKGFALGDALLTGVETRTSSPVRIPRDDYFEALGTRGLYPAGEGAGYAGGIVSAGVDGIRIAGEIIRKYSQPG